MEEALYDMALFREFVGLDAGEDNLPEESTILRFRHLLEAYKPELADPGHCQRHAGGQGSAAQGRNVGRCHADRRTELDQEQQRRARP
jgi:IS5 family transposase